ncbi:hypothetical protein [Falsiroseomonas oryziterrae]|uniref:hypothetical protein n=1 Tax=Falsiroseomonas oryziterrae TaxID=2911368 RepID=UPI001F32B88B|nr:hypothetical protein [Roseomonas sp. NPKOSM-4]
MASHAHTDVDLPREAAVTHGFMAVGFAAVTVFISSYLPWPWVFDIYDPEFNPMVALPLMLAGVTVLETVRTVRAVQRHRRFGGATLELANSGPLPLGARLRGTVRTARPLSPTGNYRVLVACADIHEFTNPYDHGGPFRDYDFVVWKREIEVPAAGLDSTRGIPFDIRLPESVGPRPEPAIRPTGSRYFTAKTAIMIPGLRRIWTHNSPPVGRTWLLEVSAPMPGTDFRAVFPLPIDDA